MRAAVIGILAAAVLDAQQAPDPVQPLPAAPPAETVVPSKGTVVTTRSVLDRYLLGQYEEAVRGKPMLLRFDLREADRWVRAGGPAQIERRRLAAAVFALEYAAARPSLMPTLLFWGRGMLAEAKAPRPIEAL